MNTVDLVKMASERSYMSFETAALDMLKAKLSENDGVKAYQSKLNVAKGLSEACKDEKNEEDEDKDGKEKELEEQEEKDGEKSGEEKDGEKSGEDKDDSEEKDDDKDDE